MPSLLALITKTPDLGIVGGFSLLGSFQLRIVAVDSIAAIAGGAVVTGAVRHPFRQAADRGVLTG